MAVRFLLLPLKGLSKILSLYIILKRIGVELDPLLESELLCSQVHLPNANDTKS